jgi:hypothetical protein
MKSMFHGMRAATWCWITVLMALAVLGGAAHVQAQVPGDTEPNGAVDLRDLLVIRNAFGQTGEPGFTGADVDENGVVDNDDLLIWRGNYPTEYALIQPYISIAAPVDGSLIGDRKPSVVIDFGATAVTLDPETLVLVVDGQDRTAEALVSSTNAVLPIEQPLPDGAHYVEASIDDTDGATYTDRSDFEVTTLTLLPKAFPPSGPAPLTPRFTPDVVWADDPPSHYLWDWDNDGTWDNGTIGGFDASARPDTVEHTFLQEGVHTVRFGVYQGGPQLLTETTIEIAVTESYASVSPGNGSAPLTVFLHGIAADLDDPITLYEWDYDYDGAFSADYSSTDNASTVRIYAQPGVYRPVFRATYQSGAIVEYPIVQGELYVNASGYPTAVASAAQGGDALTINFAGSALDDGEITLYEWDFDNDGTYDYSSPTSGQASHTYATAGEKIAAFRVTDNDTNTTVDRVRVETFAPASLEVLDDTLDVLDDEEVTIRFTTTIDSTVTLRLKERDGFAIDGSVLEGRTVKTLVDDEFLPAGTYDYTWDGFTENLQPAHPDAYMAILEYAYPGRDDTLDLTRSTGETHYFATRLTTPPSGFNPLLDEFWEMGFEIPSASRCSLYILPGGNNRTATPFDNLPLGAGQYTYYWAGLGEDGEFAPPQAHLWSVNGWTLPDNAIVVRARPEVTNLDVAPNLYSPTDRPTSAAPLFVNFETPEAVATIIKVVRMDNGRTVRTLRSTDFVAGPQYLEWDGRTEDGTHVTPGEYSFGVQVVDERGNVSILRFAVCRVSY